MVKIASKELQLEINSLGAELFSIQDLQSGHEYLWTGDPQYWKSRSPILFPIVGALYNGECRIEGKEYAMKQHGFARHYEFAVVKHTANEAIFSLSSSEQSRAEYPYDFRLEIGYKIEGTKITISYNVHNPSQEVIYFQLGAHPGFNFRDFETSADAPTIGYFALNDHKEEGKVSIRQISNSGFMIPEKREITLEGNRIAITKELFNADALILEDDQSHSISLLDLKGSEYVRVNFDAPVVGLWSKAHDCYAPFTCIEPWYGRCDSEGYQGEFKDRDWTQSLPAGDNFSTEVSIEVFK